MSNDALKKKLTNLPECDSVREIKAQYERTGTYRPADLQKLLGNPLRRVTPGSNKDLIQRYSSHRQR